jgi:hypothetical protein
VDDLVRHVGAGDRLQAGGHGLELCLAEKAGEVLPDAAEVGQGRLPERSAAALGDARQCDPAVLGVGASGHQASFLQPVHGSGQTTG